MTPIPDELVEEVGRAIAPHAPVYGGGYEMWKKEFNAMARAVIPLIAKRVLRELREEIRKLRGDDSIWDAIEELERRYGLDQENE